MPPPKTHPVSKVIQFTHVQIANIKTYAAAHGLTDSEAIRQLIDAGLLALSSPALETKPPRKRK